MSKVTLIVTEGDEVENNESCIQQNGWAITKADEKT